LINVAVLCTFGIFCFGFSTDHRILYPVSVRNTLFFRFSANITGALHLTDYRTPTTDYLLPITEYRLLITEYFTLFRFAALCSFVFLQILPVRCISPITEHRQPVTDY